MSVRSKTKTITINGKKYELESLSDKAKKQLDNIRAADIEIARLKTQLAITQTARNAYLLVLNENLPQTEH